MKGFGYENNSILYQRSFFKVLGRERDRVQEETDLRGERCVYKFLPVSFMKLVEKERIGARIRKRYDSAKTQYQRVLENEHVSEEVK